MKYKNGTVFEEYIPSKDGRIVKWEIVQCTPSPSEYRLKCVYDSSCLYIKNYDSTISEGQIDDLITRRTLKVIHTPFVIPEDLFEL